MANKFTNFLGSVTKGATSVGNLRDQQHASRLYRDNFYEYTPKAGWMYYVKFNLNINDIYNSLYIDKEWLNKHSQNVGLLSKSADLPRFNIKTETLNQYNKKTIVQTSIQYMPVSISLHDDMVNATSDLWRNYYMYYYADGRYYDDGTRGFGNAFSEKVQANTAFSDLKYNPLGHYTYGYNRKKLSPFFQSIEIYELNRKRFAGVKLINPIITDWSTDPLDQTQGQKLLSHKVTIAYESVIYLKGDIKKDKPAGFATHHYDTTPSPLSIGGKGTTSLFGVGGVVPGAADVFGTLTNPDATIGDYIGAGLKAKNIIDNAKKLNSAALKQEGYSILSGTLSNVQSKGSVTQGFEQTVSGITQSFSPVGVQLFKGSNSSTNGATSTQQNRNV